MKSLSRVQLLATRWTASYQAPPSMGFSQATVLEWIAIAFSKGKWLTRAIENSKEYRIRY